MDTRTIAGLIAGSDRAILRIAADRRALWVGAFLVVVAGVAREHDRRSLLHEPWWVVLPLVVSTLEAALCFAVVYPCALFRRERDGPGLPRWDRAGLMFLGVFWMTAPIALLHAIPWHRLSDPGAGVAAEVATSAVVIVWRVALLARIVRTMFGVPAVPTWWLVLLASDLIAAAVFWLAPDLVVRGAAFGRPDGVRTLVFSIQLISLAAIVPLLIGVSKTLSRFVPWWTIHRYAERGRVGWLLIAALAAGSATLLAWSQPAQARAVRAERLLASGDYRGLTRLLAGQGIAAFPAGWSPPPGDLAEASRIRDPLAFSAVIGEGGAELPGWVRDAYIERLDAATRLELWPTLTPWPLLVEGVFRGEAPPDRRNLTVIVEMLEFLLREGSYGPGDRAAIAQTRDILRP